LIDLPTTNGGLLRQITPWFALVLNAIRVSATRAMFGGPSVTAPAFQTKFHLAIGAAIAVEPFLPGRPVVKGFVYAFIAAWLLNAGAVLPATGSAWGGHLTLAGMIWFAAADTLFVVVMAVLCAAFRQRRVVAKSPLPR
jgi:hypothetical protein